MILPATHVAALLLLVTALICLGSWINTFKAARKWRFELFAIDFAIGGTLLMLIVAYTLGTLGSDLAFSDRMLVAGRTDQVLAIVAGAVFNLGNMLLLAAVSLIGISTAFPLSVGLALIVSSGFHFHPANAWYLTAGIFLMLIGIGFEMRAAVNRLRVRSASSAVPKQNPSATVPAAASVSQATAPAGPAAAVANAPATARVHHSSGHHHKRVPSKAKPKPENRSRRGIAVAIFAGIALGLFQPVLQKCVPGDLGLGAYAGMLLFGVGVLISSVAYDFFFLNIAIEGGSLTFGAYLQGDLRQHLLGFAGGAVCIGGILAVALAWGASTTAVVSDVSLIVIPLASVILAYLFGLTVWREFAEARPGGRAASTIGILLFAASVVVLAIGLSK